VERAQRARSRNGQGAFTLVSANGGLNLYQGNNNHRDAAAGGAIDLGEYPALPELTEAQRDKVYQKWAVAWIKEHPGEFLRRVPIRIWRTFSPLETGNNGQVPVPQSWHCCSCGRACLLRDRRRRIGAQFSQLAGLVAAVPADRLCGRSPCRQLWQLTLQPVDPAVSDAARGRGRWSPGGSAFVSADKRLDAPRLLLRHSR
jgi:hypothetical protein